ncbi:MAG: hypothetical protein ACRDXF_02985 [Acidimicrobiia bacterium]
MMDTFVVRVWGPMADGGEETGLRGVVEHVASGRSDRFRSVDELVSFLRAPDLKEAEDSLAGEA